MRTYDYKRTKRWWDYFRRLDNVFDLPYEELETTVNKMMRLFYIERKQFQLWELGCNGYPKPVFETRVVEPYIVKVRGAYGAVVEIVANKKVFRYDVCDEKLQARSERHEERLAKEAKQIVESLPFKAWIDPDSSHMRIWYEAPSGYHREFYLDE